MFAEIPIPSLKELVSTLDSTTESIVFISPFANTSSTVIPKTSCNISSNIASEVFSLMYNSLNNTSLDNIFKLASKF